MERTLSITGIGNLSLQPDIAVIEFPLRCTKRDYTASMSELNKMVIGLQEIINKFGIDPKRLKTNDFNVSKETQWNKLREVHEFVGFRTSHDMSLEIPFDNTLMHKILQEIVKSGFDIDFEIRFTISDKEAAINRLLELAIKNAKEKAEIITRASGVSLQEIININYSFSDIHIHSTLNMRYGDSNAFADEASAPDINPSDVDLSKNVTITWRIE